MSTPPPVPAPTPRPSLLTHLLKALSTHPGSRTFHLHVLITSPRKSNSLYPFATPRPPRVYVQDVLVLLSEERPGLGSSGEPKAPRILTFALEATLYLIPPTSTLLLYISKLDTSGYTSPVLPPPTSLLTRSFISYYFNPHTRPVEFCGAGGVKNVWVQLFARAPPQVEKQYLFAGSGEYEGKMGRWRGDRGLCVWWRRVLGRVVDECVVREGEGEVGMYFLLPGYNEAEAEDALRLAVASAAIEESKIKTRKWMYGHPYSATSSIPLPCPYDPKDPEAVSNLGRYIPYFDDCPKSRFLDEIAYATEVDVKSPQKKRRKGDGDSGGRQEVEKEKEGKEKRLRPLGEMGRVSAHEFWERMSFRQECVSGAVTGFFTICISSPTSSASGSVQSPLQPQPGQVPSQINKRVLTTLLTGVEFSDVDKAIRGTEIVESTIKSLCEGRSVPMSTRGSASAGANALARTILAQDRPKTPEPQERAFLTVLQTPPPPTSASKHGHMPEVSPNPFAEPVVTAETYGTYIYGRVLTDNAVLLGTQQAPKRHVTVLAVRKKKGKM